MLLCKGQKYFDTDLMLLAVGIAIVGAAGTSQQEKKQGDPLED
jgi:hypothetical protein